MNLTEQDVRNKYREVSSRFSIPGDTEALLKVHEDRLVCECYVSGLIADMSLSIQDVERAFRRKEVKNV